MIKSMAVSSSLLNSLCSFSLSPLPPPPPPTTVALPSPSSSKALKIEQLAIPELSPRLQSILCPSLTFSHTLFFKSAYNVQVIVDPQESEESLIGRFRREVFKANIIQECKRRRFFETNQEKRKRKIRDAARRRARRRPRPVVKKEENPEKKVVDEEEDNWDVNDVEAPYCQSF